MKKIFIGIDFSKEKFDASFIFSSQMIFTSSNRNGMTPIYMMPSSSVQGHHLLKKQSHARLFLQCKVIYSQRIHQIFPALFYF